VVDGVGGLELQTVGDGGNRTHTALLRCSSPSQRPGGAQRAGSRGVARSRGARRSGSQPEGVARPDCTARSASRAPLLRSAAGPCESSSAAPLRGRPGGEGHRSRSAAPLRTLQLELRSGVGHLQGLGRWRELDLASASRVSPCSASSGWSVGSSTSGSARRRRTVCGGRAGRVVGGFRAGAGGITTPTAK
jgi:hypothetical protein